jgi:Rod binding domain-containing protein
MEGIMNNSAAAGGLYTDEYNRTAVRQVPREPSLGDSPEKLEEVAREFESLFVKQMLDSMRSSLDTESDMLHGGFAQDVFEDMLYDEYAQIMAKSGDYGIAGLIIERYGSE